MKIPSPPKPGMTCETCIHWLSRERARFLVTMTEIGMQQIPIADAIKRGLSMPKDAVVDAAKCTESPLWGMTISNHWCGRHPALARDIELRSVRHDMQEAKDYKIASDPPDRALPSGIKFGPD